MKAFWIILVILIVFGGIFFYIYYNRKTHNSEWDTKCRESGGKVTKSGQSCDYLNCDRSKYSCSFPTENP